MPLMGAPMRIDTLQKTFNNGSNNKGGDRPANWLLETIGNIANCHNYTTIDYHTHVRSRSLSFACHATDLSIKQPFISSHFAYFV